MKQNKRQVRYATLKDRIMANIVKQAPPPWANVKGDCWIWQCSLNARGYGHISIRIPERGKPYPFKVLVHRLVLFVFCGIPMREIDTAGHLCSTKPCCNPDHVDAGTALENRDYYYNVERFAKLALAAPKQEHEIEDWVL